ncbi:hypothetical protein EBZ39_18560, partial [bacterium]|nr:hypothetical protein [bacterium]
MFLVFFVILALFLVATLLRATYLVRQAEVIIIERFGSYHAMLEAGIHFVIPFIDRPRTVPIRPEPYEFGDWRTVGVTSLLIIDI